jgi:hypothetical protein
MKYKSELSVLIGAAAGGLFGYALFLLLVRRGYHGLTVPGGLLGLGAGLFRTKSKAIPIICGVAALVLGLFTQWRLEAYFAGITLTDFLLHVHQLAPFTLLMIGAGSAIGFYVPFRRGQEVRNT